jgi:Lar family restriction alleviation protein
MKKISKKTLKTIDESMANLAKGKVSKPINNDLKEFEADVRATEIVEEPTPTISKSVYKRLVAQMDKCPFCGKKDGDVYVVHFHHWVAVCTLCDAEGPVRETAEMAVKHWNRREP